MKLKFSGVLLLGAVSFFFSGTVLATSVGYGGTTAPDAPTGLAITAGASKATVSWADSDGTVDSYTVSYGLDATADNKSKSVAGENNSTTIKNLSSNKKYYTKVLATNTYGDSDYSDVAVFRTKPEIVSKVRAENTDATSLLLRWKKAKGRSVSYRVQVLSEDGDILKKYKTRKTYLQINGLESDTTYNVKIRAFTKHVLGNWSEEITVTTGE